MLKAIETEAEYGQILAKIEALIDLDEDTPEGDRLGLLLLLVEAWETKRKNLPSPTPAERLRFRMEQKGRI